MCGITYIYFIKSLRDFREFSVSLKWAYYNGKTKSFSEFAVRPAMVVALKTIAIFAVPLRAARCFVIIDSKYVRPKVRQGRGDRNKS